MRPQAETPANTESDRAIEPDTAEQSDEGLATADSTDLPFPTECATDDEPCVPPRAFVKRLCRGKFPSVSIVMFEKDTPWTRVYVRQPEVEAVNTVGGPSSEQNLVFGEELLLLEDTSASSGGIQVSGSGYFVLRWDGTCVTVGAEEVVGYAPGALKNAPIVWRYLDNSIQDALLKKSTVKNAYGRQREQCKGARPGQGDHRCEKARELLNAYLTMAVRSGIELPEPEKRP
jgi:hypothetical protein